MEQSSLPEFYFSFQVFWLRLMGVELLEKNESLGYRIYSKTALVFTTTFVLVEFFELTFHSDFNLLVDICNYAFCHGLGVIKIVVVYIYRKEIGDLMKSLHEGHFKPNKERGGEFEEQCIKEVLEQTRFQMNGYGLAISVVYTAGLLTSLKSRLTEPPELWRLSFTPISLVNTTYSPNFEIVYIYQAVGVFMISVCIYISDVTVFSIIAHAGAQLKILNYCVRSYKIRGLRKYPEEGEKSVSNSLRDTIEQHLALLGATDTTEYLCSYLTLSVFLINLILLCILMYNTSMISLHSIEFVKYSVYCFAVAVQILLYCWWGNEMTLANEQLALTIAEAYNPEDPIAHAKALKLMLIKAQRPLILTAGKFVPLSLETYKGIIKGSFSYFTVLRQANSK